MERRQKLIEDDDGPVTWSLLDALSKPKQVMVLQPTHIN